MAGVPICREEDPGWGTSTANTGVSGVGSSLWRGAGHCAWNTEPSQGSGKAHPCRLDSVVLAGRAWQAGVGELCFNVLRAVLRTAAVLMTGTG